MSKFSLIGGRLNFSIEDGALSPEEALVYATIEVRDHLEAIADKLSSIEFALAEGEIKVHRTQ